MEGSLGLFIEALVAVLLVVTIGYCIQVNRKLEQLRSDQSELRRTIHELNEATSRAEAAIANLRMSADAADERLAGHTESARDASERLRGEIAEAQTLLNKLATITRAQRRAPDSAPAAQGHPGPRASGVGIGLLNARQRGTPDDRRSAA